MRPLLHLAADLDQFLRARGWRYCFIGGVANQRWGRPRTTVDVDVTLLTGMGEEEGFIDDLLAHYPPRIPEARSFALEHRVLLLQSPDGIGIDISLGAIAFEEKMVARATRFEFLPGISLPTCSAEDFIVLKAFADRSGDWLDIEGVLTRRQGDLDWDYIVSELTPLADLKEASHIVIRLQRLREDHS